MQCHAYLQPTKDTAVADIQVCGCTRWFTGEVAMLSSANTELGLRMSATATRNTQLQVQLDGVQARLITTEQRLGEKDEQMKELRSALADRDSLVRRGEQQVRELESRLMAAGQEKYRLEHKIRYGVTDTKLACTMCNREGPQPPVCFATSITATSNCSARALTTLGCRRAPCPACSYLCLVTHFNNKLAIAWNNMLCHAVLW